MAGLQVTVNLFLRGYENRRPTHQWTFEVRIIFNPLDDQNSASNLILHQHTPLGWGCAVAQAERIKQGKFYTVYYIYEIRLIPFN